MAKASSCMVLQLLFTLACVSSSFGNYMGSECSSLKNVEIHYKNYFDLFLGDNPFLVGLNHDGLYVKILKEVTRLCCSTAQLSFHFVQQSPTDDKEIEEMVMDSVKADRNNPNDGVVKFFYPEFAYKKLLQVYDTQTPFLRLSRSPGPALLMQKPEAKQPVFVGEIFVKSWAIMIFLIMFAWVVGILVWVTDHHVNPKDFPSPFYLGMIEGFWWSVVTMTTVGYGDKTPKSAFGRVLAVCWIMISTVFLSLFTANASSILAISQAEEDYTNTLGKKIGCFNSKHFFDVEVNLGAQMIGFSNVLSFIVASQTGQVDRILFPNYLDYMFLSTKPEYAAMNEGFILTNTLDHPFQIGMTYAVDPANMTAMEDSFFKCMRSETPTIEKRLRREIFGLSKIKSEKSLKEEIKVPLDSDNLLTLTYWFFVIIACLVALGLSWDFWVYWKRIRPHAHDHGTEQGNVEMAEVSTAGMNGGARAGGLNEDAYSIKSGSLFNMEHWTVNNCEDHRVSITGSCVPPAPPTPPTRS